MRLDVTLRNDRARQFQRLKEEIEQERGHEVTRVEVLGILMAGAEYDVDGF